MKKFLVSLFVMLLCIEINAQEEQPEGSAGTQLDSIIARITSFKMEEGKEDSLVGKPLGRFTETDFKRRFEFYDSLNTVLKKMDESKFSFNDQINIDLLKYITQDEVSTYQFKAYLNPILSDEGFHTELAYLSATIFKDKTEADEYLIKLNDAPRFVNEHLALMREGLKKGICQPTAILDGYENTYNKHIVDDPVQSVFYQPFTHKPASVSADDWKALQERAKIAINNKIVPTYKSIKDFFDKEYLPKTRKTIGVSNFPNGLAYYQSRVTHYTTSNETYEEVYETGLREVARIDSAMRAVLKEVHFKGDMPAFFAYLRTDPKFYVTTPEALLKEASYIAKQIDGKLPSMFGKLPRQPYGVEPVPAYLAPTYTTGRYSGAPIHSNRGAHYWVNTYNLKSRPLYVLESLTMHEAVPGHHLQIALAQELENVPEFRKELYVDAFGEGWGLYAEFLGTEMGLYKDPYTRFGRLTYEMWRACRLVIDVGLHAKGWTRDQAVKYLSEHSALSLHEVNTEINRYIAWPGQALAYKTGELKIRELRAKAEKALGEKFDVRDFHDMLLSQGAVTMPILEKMVDRFIAQQQ